MLKEYLILTIKCGAPAGLFGGDFDDLSIEHQALFEGPDRVVCDAGTPGRWCLNCRFGDIEEERGVEFTPTVGEGE